MKIMPGWVENLLAAIGGSTVALIAILTIFKKLLMRLFESGVEASFEKSLAKFKNRLERSTTAYEMLLNRELKFYEKLEPMIAELIPLEHDLLYYLKYDENADRKQQCESFRGHFKRYCELIKELKNECLIHQSYIPYEVFHAYVSVVNQMQDDIPFWFDMLKLLFDCEYDKIDYKMCESTISRLLSHFAFAETTVRNRLNQLSGEDH